MNRLCKLILPILILLSLFPTIIFSENQQRNPIEWLEVLERETFGAADSGGLVERLDYLEKKIIGKTTRNTISERLSYLDHIIYVNRPHDISLIYKAQSLEWILQHEVGDASLERRLEKLELTIFSKKFEGPYNQRFERLIAQVFPKGIVRSTWVTVPKGLKVKVRLLDELSSTKNSIGDVFRYQVVETVVQDSLVLLPKGTTGIGVVRELARPQKWGKDARLGLDFQSVRALDGTSISLMNYQYGSKNSRTSYNKLMQTSLAGMALLGPEGILIGLAIKGKETELSSHQEFYLEVKETVRIVTLSE